MNARFWIYINGGFVKLTLRPEEALEHFFSERTDEGFRSVYQSWEYDGSVVVRQWFIRERDCDGRHEDGGVAYWDDGKVAPSYSDPDTMLPVWVDGEDYYHRDHTAEAMGY